MPIIIILSVLSIGLLLSLFFVKREIRSVRKQLYEYSVGVEKPIDIMFIDRDVTELAAEINKNQTMQKENKLSCIKKEERLKESVSNISHDLRTPLTSITGYLQLLQKMELTDEQREYVDISLSRGRYLQNLIQDFYEISLIEGKESIPKITKINLDNILAEMLLSFTEQFEDKGITPAITFLNTPTYVMADETMLKRIITNLISNALRYGSGTFEIELSKHEYVEVIFQNKMNHPKNIDAARLFEKFYTVDLSRSQSGSGLGLYIVKLLAEKMNGTISASLNDTSLAIRLCFVKA